MNVNLGESFDQFVASLVASGEYQSQSEVVREGLRLLKEREELRQIRLQELRREVQKGADDIEQGRYVSLSSPQEVDAFFEDIKKRGRERLDRGRKNTSG